MCTDRGGPHGSWDGPSGWQQGSGRRPDGKALEFLWLWESLPSCSSGQHGDYSFFPARLHSSTIHIHGPTPSAYLGDATMTLHFLILQGRPHVGDKFSSKNYSDFCYFGTCTCNNMASFFSTSCQCKSPCHASDLFLNKLNAHACLQFQA